MWMVIIIWKKFIIDRRLIIILACAIVRMGFLGFKYYPLLDDYIQYGVYGRVDEPFLNLYIKGSFFAARPLASICDIYIWSRFWNNMGVILFLFTVLHACSAYLFIVSFEKAGVKLGLCFAVFFVLYPLNFEASYWISASSRLIVGVFFVAVSCYMLVYNRKILFFIFQLLSFVFYEQIIILGIIVSCYLIFKIKNKKCCYIMLFNFLFIAVYYLIFSRMGSFGARAELRIINLEAVYSILASWNFRWFFSAFMRIFTFDCFWYGIAIFAVCICLYEKRNRFDFSVFVLGIFIFVFGYVSIIILKNYTVGLRNCFVPLIGFALVIDSALNLVRHKPVLVCVLAMFFVAICLGELVDYRGNYFADAKIIEQVGMAYGKSGNNLVLNARRRNIKSNFDFAEHILAITSSDWAITGAVRQFLGDFNIPYFILKQ